MRYTTIFVHISLILFFLPGCLHINAQKITEYSTDTLLFNKYKGTLKYAFFVNEQGEQVKNGKYSFASIPQKELQQDVIQISDINVDGNYKNGLKHHVWVYKTGSLLINDLTVQKGIRLNYQLLGIEKTHSCSYKNGQRHGNWEVRSKKIVQGKTAGEELNGKVNYKNDTLSGSFSFIVNLGDTNRVEISGRTNNNGFLDGVLILKYKDVTGWILEERNYEEGFLTEIIKKEENTKKLYAHIVFNDVKDALSRLHDSTLHLNYKIGEAGFDLEFNNGYRPEDPKIKAQRYGNLLITHALEIFEQFNDPAEQQAHITSFKPTRRFQFIYPAYEAELLKEIVPKTQVFHKEVQDLINRPNLMLRKENSDSLFYSYVWLVHTNEKIKKVKDVICKIDSGYFDFRQRDNYYEQGIRGLNEADSVKYIFDGKEKSVPYRVNPLINSADSILLKLTRFMDSLRIAFEVKKELVSKSLVFYNNQNSIDSLDSKISEQMLYLDSLYPRLGFLKNVKPDKVPFSYKVCVSLNERLINPFRNRYLHNSLSLEEEIILGKEIHCLLHFLNHHKNQLDAVGDYPAIWRDSLFTLYRNNPFDDRMLESKILQGTQQACISLLRYYATELLNAKTCQALKSELDNIVKLEQRVKYLIKNYTSENVQLLDKNLRRERIPIRIKRILEL